MSESFTPELPADNTADAIENEDINEPKKTLAQLKLETQLEKPVEQSSSDPKSPLEPLTPPELYHVL
jgi:hypothetical protein